MHCGDVAFVARPTIHFIVKRYRGPADVEESANWRLLRSDVDTW